MFYPKFEELISENQFPVFPMVHGDILSRVILTMLGKIVSFAEWHMNKISVWKCYY